MTSLHCVYTPYNKVYFFECFVGLAFAPGHRFGHIIRLGAAESVGLGADKVDGILHAEVGKGLRKVVQGFHSHAAYGHDGSVQLRRRLRQPSRNPAPWRQRILVFPGPDEHAENARSSHELDRRHAVSP